MTSPAPLVLVVDDSEISREVLSASLLLEALRVETASSGEEALQKARLYRPDLVLLDVMMPGMDGFEVCRRLRDEEALAEIPILFVTALDDRESRLRGLAVGADDFLARPLDMLELRARVRSICRLNRYRKIVEERARVGQLFEFAAHGIALLDENLLILAANPALRSLRRIGVEEGLIGQCVLDWVPEGLRGELRSILMAVFEDLSLVPHHETAVRQLSGEVRLVDLTVGPCPWDGRTALQVFFRDSTELRRAKQASERLLRTSAVASSAFEIVHKFNNYLSVISMNAELLEHDGSVEAILEACEQASALSDRILAFVKRDKPSAIAAVEVDSLLSGMIPALASLIGSRHQLLLDSGLENGGLGLADEDQLRDVVLGLVMNARDAMADGGVITLRTASENDNIVISVEDCGEGIRPELQEAIFEPFFTSRRKEGSTGLGLSTAVASVAKWGGRIEVVSTRGSGSVFSIVLKPTQGVPVS